MLRLSYNPPTYICSCCGEEKPETEYYRQSYTNERCLECKVCTNVKRSIQRHRAKHGKFISKEKHRTMTQEIDYTLDDWTDAAIFFGGLCCYCGKPEGRARKAKFDREHLVPISRGGKTVRNNIVGACPQCNRSKGGRELFEWYREQPFWTQDREDKIIAWMEGDI